MKPIDLIEIRRGVFAPAKSAHKEDAMAAFSKMHIQIIALLALVSLGPLLIDKILAAFR
jgi:hypothetical protein